MNNVLNRYSKITYKFPREFILLQGKGCFWKKCTFCDYYSDTSDNAFEINRSVLQKVTGFNGVLDVINSGSTMEIDEKSINLLIKTVKEKNIKELWLEVHWAYRNVLEDFAKKFEGVTVKYRTGIETFDPNLRKFWNKGVPENVTPFDVAKYFKSVCILVGTEGQTFETVVSDIEIAQKYFERFMINIFCPNTTNVKPNHELIDRFMKEIYPTIKDNPKIEISLNTTDLGVG